MFENISLFCCFKKGEAMDILQKTLARALVFEGVGIHSGQQEKIYCQPTLVNQGIIFEHVQTGIQIIVGQTIPVSGDCATVLMEDGWRLSTVEHFLAACAAVGLDNLLVLVEGNELPILDGSAIHFIEAFQNTGFILFDFPIKKMRPRKKICIEKGQGRIVIEPHSADQEALFLSVSVKNNLLLSDASFDLEHRIEGVGFLQEIAAARTFGRFDQWDYLKQRGLALGATRDNVIVWQDGAWLPALRWHDEPMRHKVLDCFGDLFLLGRFLFARIIVCNSGHTLHKELIEYALKNVDVWDYF